MISSEIRYNQHRREKRVIRLVPVNVQETAVHRRTIRNVYVDNCALHLLKRKRQCRPMLLGKWRVVMSHAWVRPNENKMSAGG